MSKEISEYDTVEVIALNPDVPEASIGDQGAVLMVHLQLGEPEAFEVECVLPNGTNKWQGSFPLGQIMLVSKS